MAKKIAYFVKLLVYISLCNVIVCGQGPIVNTAQGQVRGIIAEDGDYNMFLGIPFAKVNVSNPFGEALPPHNFDGIFEANDDSAICPQREEFNHTIVGTLDCLHLNIHVPNTASPTNLRPVFVWIYGGGFTIGFYGRYLYGAKFLVRHDILFVTINYRLGPYGFMCLDIPEVPGNQGFKDQLLALKWLQENIANFGGDPDKVTLAGNSAGSISVDYHLLTEDNGPKLFQQAVLQSGTAYAGGANQPALDTPLQLAEHLGFETNDIYEAIAFLANVDPLVIIESSLDLSLSAGLCIEKKFENIEAFTTKDVTTINQLPESVKNMTVMIGFNNDEVYSAGLNGLTESDELVILSFMQSNFDWQHPDFNFMVDNVRRFYFGDEVFDDDQVQNYVDFLGDLTFIYPSHRSMKRLLDNDVNKMYLYKFSYDGERNFVKHRENYTGGGAYHADELGYLFDISYMDEPSLLDQLVIDGMTALWANFVKYADPTPSTSELLPHKWEAITKDSPYHYIDIDEELSVGTRPLQERMAYWDLFYDGYGISEPTELDPESQVERRSEIYRLMKKIMRYV